jgi:hypothetical protein
VRLRLGSAALWTVIILLGLAVSAEAQGQLFSPKSLFSAPLPGEAGWRVNALNTSKQAVRVLIYLCDPIMALEGQCVLVANESLAPGHSTFGGSPPQGFTSIYRYAKVIYFGPSGAIQATIQSVDGHDLPLVLPVH